MSTFVIQPTTSPVNENVMELLIMVDALRRASAGSITAVIPYYGYGRQDRKVAPRTPITSKLVADLLQAAGVTRVVSVDLHAGQIQGFFNIPFDHLYAMPVMLEEYLKKNFDASAVCVSPDAGGVERARAYSKRLNASLAIVDKRRERANVSEVMNLIGDVKGRDCIIIDDMIDTAGTLTGAAQALRDRGAKRIVACATHGVLSGPAIGASPSRRSTRSSSPATIPLTEAAKTSGKIKQVSIGRLLGEAIKRIHSSWTPSARCSADKWSCAPLVALTREASPALRFFEPRFSRPHGSREGAPRVRDELPSSQVP
ncbi:MAG: ribose-phosphate pyrophosphokinase [Polyangiaceae bacterium]